MAERERPVRDPVDPRLAATVLLLRDHKGEIEVFMVVRHQQIDFASGALVFPGGSVDEGDRSLAWHSAQDVGGTAALALRITAIRETFEESGILLARQHGEDEYISDQDIADLQRRYRPSLLAGNITFESIIAAENLTLATDCLTPFSHWITLWACQSDSTLTSFSPGRRQIISAATMAPKQ